MLIRLQVQALLCALCAGTGPVAAQRVDPAREPRAIVDSFIAATNLERWADAVAFLDLPSFLRFFEERVNTARAALPQPEVTVEELMAEDSTLPRAVAEWQVAKSRELAKQYPFGDFSEEFAGITSFRALQALEPAEAAARWLQAEDPRAAFRRAIASAKCPQSFPDSIRTLSVLQVRTLGAALTDDTTAYVLVADGLETGDDPLYSRPPHLILVRRTRVGWRIMPQPGLLAGQRNISFIEMECPRKQSRR
jgi:hypothetical protein